MKLIALGPFHWEIYPLSILLYEHPCEDDPSGTEALLFPLDRSLGLEIALQVTCSQISVCPVCRSSGHTMPFQLIDLAPELSVSS